MTGWLPSLQTPIHLMQHPPVLKLQPYLQIPPILERTEAYNGNFQGLYAQDDAPTTTTHPATPPLPPPPCSLPVAPALSLSHESKRTESSWKVKCSLLALGLKSDTPCCGTPPRKYMYFSLRLAARKKGSSFRGLLIQEVGPLVIHKHKNVEHLGPTMKESLPGSKEWILHLFRN